MALDQIFDILSKAFCTKCIGNALGYCTGLDHSIDMNNGTSFFFKIAEHWKSPFMISIDARLNFFRCVRPSLIDLSTT